MNITSHVKAILHTYQIEHEGIAYVYREWVEEDGLVLIENTVERLDGEDVENEIELLDLFCDNISENDVESLPILDMKKFEQENPPQN
jgi:Mg2+/Co2+ transporter CorC